MENTPMTDTRTLCLWGLDMLASGLPVLLNMLRTNFDQTTERAQVVFQDIFESQNRLRFIKQDILTGVSYVLMVICSWLTFRPDRELMELGLSGALEKQRAARQVRVGGENDSPFLCSFRVLDGVIAMLPEIRAAILASDEAAGALCSCFRHVAHENGHLLHVALFTAIEGMGIPLRYTIADRERGFPPQKPSDVRRMLHVYMADALAGRALPEDHGRHWKDEAPDGCSKP